MSVDNINSIEEQLSPTAYLGKGLAWPPRPDPATGDFQRADAEDSISDCLMHLVTTSLGEITPIQDFGTRVDELLFAIGARAFVQSVAASIKDAVDLHERRVKIIRTSPSISTNSSGTKTVTIDLRYRIIATGKIDNIVILPPGQGNS